MDLQRIVERLTPEVQESVQKLLTQLSDPFQLRTFLGLVMDLDRKAENGDVSAELLLQPLVSLGRLIDLSGAPTSQSPLQDVLSASEAAERLGISRSAVVKAVNEGRLQAHKLGGQWVIPVAEVDQYPVAEHRVRAGKARRKLSGGWW